MFHIICHSNFGVCFLGAFAVYVTLRNRGRSPISVLAAFNLSLSRRVKPMIIVADSILTAGLGSAVSFVLVQPQTAAQALAAGLAFASLLTGTAEKIEQDAKELSRRK